MQTDFFLACPILDAICVRMEKSLLKMWSANFKQSGSVSHSWILKNSLM